MRRENDGGHALPAQGAVAQEALLETWRLLDWPDDAGRQGAIAGGARARARPLGADFERRESKPPTRPRRWAKTQMLRQLLNLHHRHLNEAQRAMAATRAANPKNGQRADYTAATPIGTAVAIKAAAKMLNVSPMSVNRARRVRKMGKFAQFRCRAAADAPIGVSATAFDMRQGELAAERPIDPSAAQDTAADIRRGERTDFKPSIGGLISQEAAETSAVRIQARAIRKCGQLLKEVESASGRNQYTEGKEGALPTLSRTEAARDAGLSEHRQKQAPGSAPALAVLRKRPKSIGTVPSRSAGCSPQRGQIAPLGQELVTQ